MASQLLIDYLSRCRAWYRVESHPATYTASGLARVGRINRHNLAKTVMVTVDGELSMVVTPSCYHVNLENLRRQLSADRVELACEKQFAHRFPRCELGAIPPFGHLYGLQAYLIPLFCEHEEIAFCAGSHSELIRMPFREYMRFAHVTELGVESAPVVARSVPMQALQLSH